MGIFSKWFNSAAKTPGANDANTAHQAGKTGGGSVKQRLQAVKNSQDAADLLDIYCHDGNDLVVDCADMRLRELLLQDDLQSLHPALLAAPLSLKTRKTLAAKAHSASLRQALLASLDDDQSLCEVIAHSDDWQIKIAAIARLNDDAALKTLIKQYRGKQKKAYRAAKTRLEQRKARQKIVDELQKRLATLITSAEAQTLTLAAVQQFEQQLKENNTHLNAENQRIFTTPLTQLHNAAAEIKAAKTARYNILQALEKTYDTLQNQRFVGSKADFHAQMNAYQHDWANLPAWSAAEAKSLNIRLEQLLNRANQAAEHYFSEKQQHNAQQKLLAQGQRWLTKPTFITADMLADLQQRWADLPTSTGAQGQYNALLAQLKDKSQQQLSAQQANDDAVPVLLEQLQSALDAGEIQQANQLHHRIRQHLNSEAKLSKPVYQTIIHPLKQLENRLFEFKRWQHFGNDQVRHELIEAMQALVDNKKLPIEEKAEQIQLLQKQWKGLHERAPQALWQQFKTLGDSAWQPCAAYFQKQRQVSKDGLKARLAFLQEAETALQAVDWQQPDWTAISTAHKQFEQLWRSFPKLQEHDYRKAKAAYRQVADIWDKHLGAERKRELQRRERLITQAQALLENDNTADSIQQVKNLQQQWVPTVGLKRREHENALWQRFKSACDAVFAKHGEQRSQYKDAENAAFAAYQGQIQALADIADNHASAFDQSKAAFHAGLQALQADDAESATLNGEDADAVRRRDFPRVSGKAAQALRAQLAQVVDRFEARQARVLADKRLAYLDQLYQQDKLCTQLEQSLAGIDVALDYPAIEQQWQAIQPLLSDGQAALRKRFDKALSLVANNDTDSGNTTTATTDLSNSQALAQAQEICLLLELSADLPSPESAQTARDKLRFTMLDAAMNGDKSFADYQSEQGLYALALRWFSLEKTDLNKAFDGITWGDWQTRFVNAYTAARQRYQLALPDFA